MVCRVALIWRVDLEGTRIVCIESSAAGSSIDRRGRQDRRPDRGSRRGGEGVEATQRAAPVALAEAAGAPRHRVDEV